MFNHIGITDEIIKECTKWLYEVCLNLNEKERVFFLSVKYLYNYLSITKNNVQHVDCVAAACLLIASKFEDDVLPIRPKYLRNICGKKFFTDELIEKEMKVLISLDCKLHYFTVIDYIYKEMYSFEHRVGKHLSGLVLDGAMEYAKHVWITFRFNQFTSEHNAKACIFNAVYETELGRMKLFTLLMNEMIGEDQLKIGECIDCFKETKTSK